VVKAQILAGGRGVAGGIRKAADPEEAARIASDLLSSRLITAQTGPQGLPVRRLLVEEAVPASREAYLALSVDRRRGRLALLASNRGGMDIESLAQADPDSLVRETIPPEAGLSPAASARVALSCGLEGEEADGFASLARLVETAFRACDASLVEINPLGWIPGRGWLAMDAKIILDDSGLPRHPELAALRDAADGDPREAEASAAGLSYVRLDGDIGCLVNGAGLAMATADVIERAGGRPADFLDIGGGAGEDAVREGFRIVASDPGIKAVLINVFGGIVRCDRVARGVLRACRDYGLRPALVVRMLGTNAEEGLRLLADSGLPFARADAMDEAAAKAVAAASPGARP
jgi:succinyl-CoA synthetase beta subunit